MRKVYCPNLDREDGLDTVLEVPVPELHRREAGARRNRGRTVRSWVRSHMVDHHRRDGAAPTRAEVQLMLGVVGAPLVPQPVEARTAMAGRDLKEEPLEVSKARYIVEQYVAAAGGEAALRAATSMCATGNVRMRTTKGGKGSKNTGMGVGSGAEVAGGFVVWQKKPELWCVEMVVAGGTKLSAGSDGKVAWRQTPWEDAHACRGPPRPLRRCVQGLDPKSTADLFSSAAWVGERCIDGDDCFVLRVDADPSALRARSGAGVEVVRHGVWGYFSQRTGLLLRLEDSHLLRIRTGDATAAAESVYWETSMESSIGDYRPVEGINIAHAGRTVVSLSRSESDVQVDADARGRRSCCTSMEETWSIEEVDFNVAGLSMDCFLPPRDLVHSTKCKKEDDEDDRLAVDEHLTKDKDTTAGAGGATTMAKNNSDDGKITAVVAKKVLIVPAVTGLGWFGPAKVVAVDDAADETTAR